MKNNLNKLLLQESAEIIKTLKDRFEKNMKRHKAIEWATVQANLEANTEKLWSLNEMEITGGELDVVGYDKKTSEYIFYDCSTESPSGRRSFCYDHAALEKRKENKPKDSAMNMVAAMGVEILTEEQYRGLQQLGNFDIKTSVGLKLQLPLENWVALSFVIVDTIRFFCITTARNLTMLQGVSVGR